MKTIASLLIVVLCFGAVLADAQEPPRYDPMHHDFDEATRFIFFGVLEGLYENGVSNKDVDQILLKKEGQCYDHFIYSCPICNATIWALQTYRARPTEFYGLKTTVSTFGPGISETQHQQLYSDDPHQRLTVINQLMQGWMTKRMDKLNLNEHERTVLLEKLEKKRKDGMYALESFRKYEHGPDFGVAKAAPAYVDLEECAVCNGAVGKVMKLPSDPLPTPKQP